jgi:hypothetical protein
MRTDTACAHRPGRRAAADPWMRRAAARRAAARHARRTQGPRARPRRSAASSRSAPRPAGRRPGCASPAAAPAHAFSHWHRVIMLSERGWAARPEREVQASAGRDVIRRVVRRCVRRVAAHSCSTGKHVASSPALTPPVHCACDLSLLIQHHQGALSTGCTLHMCVYEKMRSRPHGARCMRASTRRQRS